MDKKIIYSLLTILITTVIIYANSLNNGYNMDDSLVITNNKIVNSGNLTSIFTEYSYQSSEYSFAYRPLTILSFYLENQVFGKSPQVSHIINLILYLILNIILFFLLFKISKNILPSLIITLLFLSFPLHTEVVDNIKNRDELFVAICGFLSLYFTLKTLISHNYFYLIFIFILSLCGILFKPSYLIFPPIIAISAVLFHIKSSFFKKVKVFFIYFSVAGAAIITTYLIKFNSLDKSAVTRVFEYFENPLYFSTITERILPSIYIIGYYISLLFNPFKLSYYYGYNSINIYDYSSINFILGIFFIISTFLILLFRNKNKLLVFGFILFAINLLATSNFIKPLPGIVAERFLFNGSLGFCIIIYTLLFFISTSLKKVKIRKPILLVCSFMLFISFSVKTVIRNEDWKDELTLYSHDINNVPNSAKANEMLADNYYKKYFIDYDINKLNLSEKYYLNAINIYPSYPACLNNLGTINYLNKEYKNAISYYLETLKLKDKPLTHYNLAQCYSSLGKIQMAKKDYEIALLGNPEIPNLFSQYKQLIISNNLINESISFMENSMLSKHNNNLNSYLLLIDLYNELKDYKMMLKYLKIANTIAPNPDYTSYINQLDNYLKNN